MSRQKSKYLIVITGPTASGKTALAIEAALHYGCEIVSADSRQFYRGLETGTAAPDAEQLKAVRHHFIGHLNPEQAYDVSQYEADALRLLRQLFAVSDFVVLTGGSGLYIKAVCEGLDELPSGNAEIREMLREMLEEEGLPALRTMLRKLDPEYSEKVDPANPNRLLRALEVCLSTGKPFSSFHTNTPVTRDFIPVKIGIDLPRAELHRRINARVDKMMEAGLEEEARKYYDRRHLNSLNTLGYKELYSYFSGEITRDEAVEKIKTNTRRYARRQLTWFRKDKDIIWCKPDASEVIAVINSQTGRNQ